MSCSPETKQDRKKKNGKNPKKTTKKQQKNEKKNLYKRKQKIAVLWYIYIKKNKKKMTKICYIPEENCRK